MSENNLTVTGPLDGDEGDAQQLADAAPPPPAPTAAPGRSRLRVVLSSQVMVVVLVVVVSVASLLFMRRQGMGAGMTFQAVKIEYTPPSASGAVIAKHQRILTELDRSTSPLAISVDNVQKNPFILEGAEEAPMEMGTPMADDAAARKRQREEEIRMALSGLVLNGVMDGPVPLARINGQTVRVGDVINELFLVGQIHDRSVDLLVDDLTYTVSMGSAGATPRGGRGLRANPMDAPPATPRR